MFGSLSYPSHQKIAQPERGQGCKAPPGGDAGSLRGEIWAQIGQIAGFDKLQLN